ncbi:MAG: cytochrome c biogenesis protein CcsA [Agriterribacter sp.]
MQVIIFACLCIKYNNMFQQKWWKILCVVLLAITFSAGLLMEVPDKFMLRETIRNYFFHPSLWVVMTVMFTIAVVNSVKVLRQGKPIDDIRAEQYARTGLFFGILGLATGMIWAKYTWGAFWSGDPKQTGTLIGLLIYFAYFILRNAIHEDQRRAKVAAVYNIFAYAMLFPTLFIIPRMVESLHPGSQGNPLINPSDIEHNMFLLLWCIALPGYILLGIWITTLSIRIKKIIEKDIL